MSHETNEKLKVFNNIIINVFIGAEITGLTPGKEYKFRVMAVNTEGESEPLETMTSIVAKNPFGNCLVFLSRITFVPDPTSEFIQSISMFYIVSVSQMIGIILL